MLKTISLRTALSISFSVHILFFASWGLLGGESLRKDVEKEPEVFYLYKSEPSIEQEKIIENLPKTYDIEKRPLKQKRNEDTAKKPESPEVCDVKSEDDAHFKKDPEYIKDDNPEEYISYYRAIREKIKRMVARHYDNQNKEGTVYVLFRLSKRGILEELSINEMISTDNQTLRKIALKSVRSSSPFMPFPETLRRDALTFGIPIVFKQK